MQRQIVHAVVVAALIGLVVGTVILSSAGVSCSEWQAEYREARDQAAGGALASINEGPGAERLSALESEKPDDCSIPE